MIYRVLVAFALLLSPRSGWRSGTVTFPRRLLDLLDNTLPRNPQFLRSPFANSKNTIIINIDTRGGSGLVIILVTVWYRLSQPGSKCASWILIKGFLNTQLGGELESSETFN